LDFRLYSRVLWRFRLLVMVGIVIALALALLSVVRVGTNGITYRDSELWSSMPTRLLVTQAGFPEGRVSPPASPTNSDAGRLNTLAILYAELANSDLVREVMRRDGPIRGKVLATPLKDPASGIPLPLIELAAISTSPQAAVVLAQRGANALNDYLQEEQRAHGVKPGDRVILQTILRPRGAVLFQPRSKTMPIVIFLVVMLAIVGLAFLLENLRPRRSGAPRQTEEPDVADPPVRRTA
jgi:hypothetical protein